MSYRKIVCSALIAAAIPGAFAFSHPFTATFAGTGFGQNVSVTATVNSVTSTYNVFAGQLKWNRTFANPLLSIFNGPAWTFCVDITTFVSTPASFDLESTGSATPPLPLGVSPANLAAAGNFFQAHHSWLSTGAGTVNERYAVMQVSIWSILYGGLTLGTPSLSTALTSLQSVSGINLATGTFTAISTPTNAYYWNPSTGSQAQIEYVPGGDGAGDPVPEPFTMGLVGAAALAALKRRRAKKA
ncbi:MAG: PEP-CTERM sorting domain-containing protein [Fimbriimonadaceae bacterium]